MSSVAAALPSSRHPLPVEDHKIHLLLRLLDSPWFPWVWMALWGAAQAGHALVSWHFVADGAALLRSDDAGAGLHLYAAHPQLQMGPLTFLAAATLNGLPLWVSGSVAAVVIAAAGPAMLLSMSHLPHLGVSHRQRGLAAAVLMPLWAELAVHYTHLDDALALVLLLMGLHAIARRWPISAALLLAASADAKPWAMAFVPLLFVLPRDRWQRTVLVWMAAVVAPWLPFVLADPQTLHLGGFSIPNVASSSLRALGVTSAVTPPWDRPAQLLVGCALGLVAVLRGRWLVVPAVVLAVRMLLDPGAYSYYTAGLVLATVLLDVGWRQTRWPWVSMGVVLGLYAVRFMGPLTSTNAELGWLRAATLLGVLAMALGPDWLRQADRLRSASRAVDANLAIRFVGSSRTRAGRRQATAAEAAVPTRVHQCDGCSGLTTTDTHLISVALSPFRSELLPPKLLRRAALLRALSAAVPQTWSHGGRQAPTTTHAES